VLTPGNFLLALKTYNREIAGQPNNLSESIVRGAILQDIPGRMAMDGSRGAEIELSSARRFCIEDRKVMSNDIQHGHSYEHNSAALKALQWLRRQ
jgi:hypothetical protein